MIALVRVYIHLHQMVAEEQILLSQASSGVVFIL